MAAWRVEEHFGLDWPEQAVHVQLDKKAADALAAPGEPIRVVDETGRSVPGQLVPKANPNQLWYLASLRSKEKKTYRLAQDDAAAERPLTLAVRGDVAEMANDSFAVRLSWGDGVAYSPSRQLDVLDGPLRALRGPDGLWYGKGSWAGKARCRAFRCQVVERGPVLLVVRQSYVLDSGAELTFEYRVGAATPGVTVTLQCDAPMDAVAKWEFLEPGAFEPSHAFWRAHSPDSWHGVRDRGNWFRQVYALRWPETPDDVGLQAFFDWGRNRAPFWSCWSEQSDRRDMLLIGAIRPSQTQCPDGYRPYTIRAGSESGENHLTLLIPPQRGRKLFFLGMIDRRDALPKPHAPGSKIDSGSSRSSRRSLRRTTPGPGGKPGSVLGRRTSTPTISAARASAPRF
ncbi:MAG: hypothetical protein ACC645_07210 [Pirellulales bacterium]